MKIKENIFLGKKILIYGLGKSGLSSFKFLNNKADVYLFDDDIKKKLNLGLRQKIKNLKEISQIRFDKIIISPGIDILNCKLSKILKKNFLKIHTDLDVFYSFFKNKSITITGTNGKSTTAKLLHEVLLNQKYDSRLIGNIGNPVLAEKKITKKTIFVIEASSYQLDYSKIFTTKYAVLLNISPDHIERHKNLKNYVNAKFKLLKFQSNQSVAFINKNDPIINNKIKNNSLKQKIIKVDILEKNKILENLNNKYFLSHGNRENLAFVLKISKKLKLNNRDLLQTLNRFKGLKYRQQTVYENKNLIIINDSKATSFASSENLLKNLNNIYWIIGGIPKYLELIKENELAFLLEKSKEHNFSDSFSIDAKVRKSKYNHQFNFFTDGRTLQLTMESHLVKKVGTNYGPPGKAKLVFFCKTYEFFVEVDVTQLGSRI